MLDHAALWETAQLLALRPRLVDLAALDGVELRPAEFAVLGEDPRGATPGQGESALALATERVAASVSALLEHGTPEVLRELYARRRAGYRAYVERYFHGSWEEAIQTWWREKTG
jgi:hypothetical protein